MDERKNDVKQTQETWKSITSVKPDGSARVYDGGRLNLPSFSYGQNFGG